MNLEDTNHDHHTLGNKLDNSNIKVDLEFQGNQLWLELMLLNLQTKETQWEMLEKLPIEIRRVMKDKVPHSTQGLWEKKWELWKE